MRQREKRHSSAMLDQLKSAQINPAAQKFEQKVFSWTEWLASFPDRSNTAETPFGALNAKPYGARGAHDRSRITNAWGLTSS
jgi:hypothetical protein